MYEDYVTNEYLISPINGYKTKRITSQNIKQFGFENIESLEKTLPNFPRVCQASLTRFAGEHSKKGSAVREEKNKAKYEENPKICKCGTPILPYEKRHNEFCSRNCANERNHSDETKEKIRSSVINKIKEKKKKLKKNAFSHNNVRPCSRCDRPLLPKKSTCKFCLDTIYEYRISARFNFDLSEYPDKFDFELLKKHGMYSPSNSKKPNINGVSRDHMVSIWYGYTNNIDPSIISHPANCKLVLHSENSSKKTNNCISYEELLERIKNW